MLRLMSESVTHMLKQTPLCAAHEKLGARMVEFASWLMPLQYTGILDEHLAVRGRVGLFDISHMGELWVRGPRALDWLNRMLTNDLARIAPGRAQYTLLCHERGGVIDDLIVYWLEPQKFLLIVNASNAEKDFRWLHAHAESGVDIEDAGERTGALALQGPRAADVLERLARGAAQRIGHFCVEPLTIGGVGVFAARTGYTGEDGFEFVCAAADTEKLWSAVLTAGAPFGIKPCGLGARDTLRLEMCYPLHGHELTEETTPLEAGLGMFVALDKPQFLGRETLVRQKQHGVARRLVAFRITGKTPPPRAGYGIFQGGKRVGAVTSGSLSPSLGVGIGLGYVEPDAARVGGEIGVEIRGNFFAATVERRPLYRKMV
jgi:aminomethyltransferase